MKQKKPVYFIVALISVTGVCAAAVFGILQNPIDFQTSYTISDAQTAVVSSSLNETSGNSDEIKELRTALSSLRLELDALQAKRTASNQVAEADANPTLIQQLAKEITLLQREMAGMQQHLNVGQLGQQTLETVESELSDPIAAIAEQDARISLAQQEIRESFMSQEADPQWAPLIQGQLQATVAELGNQELGAGASVVDMDCKSTMCRLETIHEDPDTAHEYELMLSLGFGDELPKFTVEQTMDEHGRTRSTYYLARAGYDLKGKELTSAPAPTL